MLLKEINRTLFFLWNAKSKIKKNEFLSCLQRYNLVMIQCKSERTSKAKKSLSQVADIRFVTLFYLMFFLLFFRSIYKMQWKYDIQNHISITCDNLLWDFFAALFQYVTRFQFISLSQKTSMAWSNSGCIGLWVYDSVLCTLYTGVHSVNRIWLIIAAVFSLCFSLLRIDSIFFLSRKK